MPGVIEFLGGAGDLYCLYYLMKLEKSKKLKLKQKQKKPKNKM